MATKAEVVVIGETVWDDLEPGLKSLIEEHTDEVTTSLAHLTHQPSGKKFKIYRIKPDAPETLRRRILDIQTASLQSVYE